MTTRAEQVAVLRPLYQRDLASGTERFFGPRRTTCPWCASDRLRERLRTPDLLQHKPGTFVIDRCLACGHHFQNPRLNESGLEFYYRDCYDGLGRGTAEGLLGAARSRKRHRVAAQSVRPFTDPERWLDVGTGYGHFPEAARQVFPKTAFDGLDVGEGVAFAESEGRIDKALRGLFTESAPSLAGQYDVVSMHHYLEHTADPRGQLQAAHMVLRSGGLLQIEVPDPESAYSGLLGRWWVPWFQPQHLHLMPCRNLQQALGEAGFTVLEVGRRAAHRPVDLAGAIVLLLSRLAPRDDAPWHPRPPSAAARRVRKLLWTGGLPAVVAAYALEQCLAPVARRTGFSNAYRILARRN
ncbi:class I SAM-dependent methyltransferase [Streptomyces sp. AV19]|uniref:class I SAM-dependent methyltransferase n=1 Tax=Streptomyces sp. AV19 TaxID=2793068 RepID=UPI0018FE7AF0|nr:class I SAM-dependent methyltransferase [Streptomyces sp. AV19]MBH1932961.1 class I SAM-dependent methyltransferase [Streptomyces sp. AV19]MDG4533868.1 class I SAM-dependent methyltransferase [Streptomyces sp. AV19]